MVRQPPGRRSTHDEEVGNPPRGRRNRHSRRRGLCVRVDGLRRDGDDGSRVSRDAARRADSGEDSGAADCANPPCDDVGDLAICIEGSVDCDDTVEEPADDVCIQIFPTPPECADPDESVGSEPPIVNDPPPDSCNLGASAADCENAACSTSDGGSRAPPR